jgi:sugar/nucleoside kinase (ribokinase family)
MNILVVGSIALDTVETPSETVSDSPGGSALYFSGAAGLFAPVNVVGVVGEDFDFDLLTVFGGKEINTDGVYTESGQTFRWGGRYYDDPNRRDTLFTHLNVFENFKPVIPEDYRNSDLIFLANIDPELQLQVLEQIKNPKLVILDTMNYWISSKRSVLEQVIAKTDVLILNDEETKQLVEDQNLFRAGNRILELGPKSLIIKKGEHGAVLMEKNGLFLTPAFPLEHVKDPTGAGDSFAGGFAGFLATNGEITREKMRQAVVYGTILASFTVEDFSFNRLVHIERKDVEERISEFRGLTAY